MRNYFSINTSSISTVDEREKERVKRVESIRFWSNVKQCLLTSSCIIISIPTVIICTYIVFVVLTVLYIYLIIAINDTVRYIIGNKLYNSSFPVCTDEKYIGSNCYITSSTYCT